MRNEKESARENHPISRAREQISNSSSACDDKCKRENYSLNTTWIMTNRIPSRSCLSTIKCVWCWHIEVKIHYMKNTCKIVDRAVSAVKESQWLIERIQPEHDVLCTITLWLICQTTSVNRFFHFLFSLVTVSVLLHCSLMYLLAVNIIRNCLW